MKKRRVGFIGYDGVTALDLTGPAEAFASSGAYEIVTIGIRRKAFVAESGITFLPDVALAEAPPLDTLMVPGGSGLRNPATNAAIARWLLAAAQRIRRVASVCTGIYGLAATGLLDGRRVTTHWRFADDVARRFPRLRLEADSLFIRDGRFYTSAGITAGIDLALAMIEEDLGIEAALQVSRELVVYLKRSGGQEQYSEPLRFQTDARDRLGELATWMRTHLQADLSVERLAQKACLSPRQFGRRFKTAFQRTPAEFVESLRLDEARRRLTAHSNGGVAQVAESVGFHSADAFRRAFLRRFGVAPKVYRERFR